MSVTVETLVEMADLATSRQVVSEIVRSAYALGKYDGIIERLRVEIADRQRKINSIREVAP